ncbi:hypothetical protein PGIGA_G00250090 [Pangasianodon gigas]|uniref:Uncharacterized protein n=1 Tax=Pangasianodon gigas TaxID=30993 RepID=A0ACC5WRG5_PANGG|nr:hypothetical protein [Pangasianodon gigas]
MSKLLKILLFLLPAVLHTANGDSLAMSRWCFWSKADLSDMEFIESYIVNKIKYAEFNSTLGNDMEFIESYIVNKIKYAEFNSTLGKYVGYTETGVRNAEAWNKNTADLQTRKDQTESVCKPNAGIYYSAILSKTVEPQVRVKLVKKSDGTHPARLMCSAYSFFPPLITVTWMRNGKEIEGGVTSTEEMADGDWYYQIHSHLEYMPESGEQISCVVEHASFKQPMEYKWDPSAPAPDKSKIAIGASGLVLGIVLSAAGFIYYKKKASGRILVPT